MIGCCPTHAVCVFLRGEHVSAEHANIAYPRRKQLEYGDSQYLFWEQYFFSCKLVTLMSAVIQLKRRKAVLIID